MVDRSFLFIKFRSICTLSGAQTFWDTLYSRNLGCAQQIVGVVGEGSHGLLARVLDCSSQLFTTSRVRFPLTSWMVSEKRCLPRVAG